MKVSSSSSSTPRGCCPAQERCVYFLALMERVAHFHLWLVPKKNEGEFRGVEFEPF
jgi:hypothetical protein